MPSTSSTTPIDTTNTTPVLSPSSPASDTTLSSPDTSPTSPQLPPSLIFTTSPSTDMTGEAAMVSSVSQSHNNIVPPKTHVDDLEESLPFDLLAPQEDQTPPKNALSPPTNFIQNTESNSRSTTPRPPTIITNPSSSASFEENQRQEQKQEDLLFEPCSPLARTSSLSISGADTPTPLSATSGDATPIPGQRSRWLRVNTGGSATGLLIHGSLSGVEDTQLQQQRVFYNAEDGSAVVHLGPAILNGPRQEPQAQDSVVVPGACSSGEQNEGTTGCNDSGRLHGNAADASPTSSSPPNVPQYATHPQSCDVLPSTPQSSSSLTSAWSNPAISPISESTPASRRTSASVDEVLIPPSSASSATFPSSASSLSTSFLSSASSTSLAFSITPSDWGSDEGGWDPAFVYGFDHGHGERKIDPSYSLKSGYPSPFFVHAGGYAQPDAGPRLSTNLGRESGYGDPLHDTEAARFGLSPDPSTNRMRFLSNTNPGGRSRRWGMGTVVRALVRPVRAGVMWTLSPLSGRSYSSPFRSFSSPFRRPSRPLTSTTSSQVVKSGSSSAQKPADFTPLLHLCLYFTLNLALTLYNKKVLGRFPFPYTLTAVHALCGWIGTGAMVWWAGRKSGFERLRALPNAVSGIRGGTRSGASGAEGLGGIGGMLSAKERAVLVAFSVLYTVNIVVSNASLRLVTVPFHQVVRASAPFFTILFSALLLGKRSSRRKLLSLVPVVIGVGFATYGDYYFTPLGFFLTLLGTLLAALKTILTNVILVKPGASSATPATPSLPTVSNSSTAVKPKVIASSTGTDEGFLGIELGQTHVGHAGDATKVERGWPDDENNNRSFFGTMFSFAEGVFRKRTKRKNSSPTLPSSSSIPLLPNQVQTPANPGTFTLGLIGLPSVRLPKLSLTPLHLLYLLSPLAFMQTMMLAQFTGELVDVRGWLFGTTNSSLAGSIGNATSAMEKNMAGVVGTGGAGWSLVLNGVMAFMLNVVSFNANRRVGPLGMSVAANVKQVLTILCAVSMFDLTITPANGLGIALTLLGGATYAYVEISERRSAAATTGKPLSTTVKLQSSNAISIPSASKHALSNPRS